MKYKQTDLVSLKELISSNQVQKAESLINSISIEAINSHEFLFIAFKLFNGLNKKDKALMFLDRAYQLSNQVDYYLILLNICLREYKFRKARELYNGSSLNEVKDYNVQLELGNLTNKLSEYSKAEKHYKKAIEINPTITALHNLAAIYRFMGKREKALSVCEKTDKLYPMHPDIIMLKTGLSSKTLDDNDVLKIEDALKENNRNTIGQAQLHFSLAKQLEDIRDYEKSFQHLNKGNSIYRNTFVYNLNEDLQFISQIKKSYSKSNISSISSEQKSAEPIFILGMPRTGSTLFERILSSHSEVDSAGELNQFVSALMYTAEKQGVAENNRVEMVKKTLKLDFNRLGERYLQTVDPLFRCNKYFIDKMPQNSLFIGLIKSALPNSKVILVERDPLDTCYAIYKQMFKDIYFFAYDQNELGHYYLAYDQLMKHWKHVLGNSIFTIKYEELINQPKRTIANLLKYCGLAWEDSCVKFYDNASASTTASATQVRENLYSSSIGKWKNYKFQLKTLEDILEPITGKDTI